MWGDGWAAGDEAEETGKVGQTGCKSLGFSHDSAGGRQQ